MKLLIVIGLLTFFSLIAMSLTAYDSNINIQKVYDLGYREGWCNARSISTYGFKNQTNINLCTNITQWK